MHSSLTPSFLQRPAFNSEELGIKTPLLPLHCQSLFIFSRIFSAHKSKPQSLHFAFLCKIKSRIPWRIKLSEGTPVTTICVKILLEK